MGGGNLLLSLLSIIIWSLGYWYSRTIFFSQIQCVYVNVVNVWHNRQNGDISHPSLHISLFEEETSSLNKGFNILQDGSGLYGSHVQQLKSDREISTISWKDTLCRRQFWRIFVLCCHMVALLSVLRNTRPFDDDNSPIEHHLDTCYKVLGTFHIRQRKEMCLQSIGYKIIRWWCFQVFFVLLRNTSMLRALLKMKMPHKYTSVGKKLWGVWI